MGAITTGNNQPHYRNMRRLMKGVKMEDESKRIVAGKSQFLQFCRQRINTSIDKHRLFLVFFSKFVRNEFAVLAILTMFFFVLGYFGWREYYSNDPKKSIFDLVYLTLQLVTIKSGAVDGTKSLPLEFARFGLAGIAIYAVVKAFVSLCHEQFMAFRQLFRKGHVIICGLSETGSRYALDFARTYKVVVIERDKDNPHLSAVRAAGVHVITGDAVSRHLLDMAGVASASHLIANCGDDAVNVQIAETTRQAVQGGARFPPLQCHVHVFNLSFLDLLDTARFFKRTSSFDPSTFNFFRTTAADLFANHPLDWKPIGPLDIQAVHLVIFGFGQMGESLTLQAARIGHFANGRKIQITVIDLAADEKIGSFLFRYSAFENICDLHAVKGRYQDVGLATLRKACAEDQTLLTVAVCFDSDFRSLECGLRLKNEFRDADFPIRVRSPQESALIEINNKDCLADQRLTLFGALEPACTVDRLLHAHTIRTARHMHDRYRKHSMAAPGMTPEKIKENDSLRPWDELDDAFRQSCIQQVEHCPVKLRAVGCSWSLSPDGPAADNSPLSGDFRFTEAEVEMLARMEHARWNTERWLAGWLLVRNKKKDLAKKTSPWLLPWEELPEEIKEYDRVMVREIPIQLKVSRNP